MFIKKITINENYFSYSWPRCAKINIFWNVVKKKMSYGICVISIMLGGIMLIYERYIEIILVILCPFSGHTHRIFMTTKTKCRINLILKTQ